MNKEFIPYEQALALKELGFDEPCFANWIERDIRDGGGIVLEMWSDEDTEYTPMSMLLAPLYQQAFRWLLALANKDKLFSNKWTISYNEDYYSLFLGGCNMGVFEAELECLKKLIEIVKENVDKQR
jgi:hypothetical protein